MATHRFTWNEFLAVLAGGASPARAREAAASLKASDAEVFANRVQQARLEAHRAIDSLVKEIPIHGALAQAKIALAQQHCAALEAGARKSLEQANALTERALRDYLARARPMPLALKLLGRRKS